ncbi:MULTISPECIES: 4'-phosphopantetheinyl transferase family protein [unclassified Streptomyces]|uniref:4'-phosphopantetheinyl transferase family protein n=1 Tax=unclassified Streptomyces TaxID=2593676 RepID=UPI0013312C25|nr:MULTISPECIES: 4'-phosphopantetheinyl transferase superfamily protein [unclassified Streptomyces]MCP3767406.1 4'-phosphopantetheinyl transferase superfamily protein [Streptomyces sp. MAR25Y5]
MRSWLVDLDADDGAWSCAGHEDGTGPAALTWGLSEEELRRAEELKEALPSHRFLRSRQAVRQLLGAWLNVPWADLRIAVLPEGKPYLPDHPDAAISWSRSEGLLLLVASAGGGPVGVDVERLRPVPAALDVLATVYPTLPAAAGPEAFLPAWTLLEAAVKATGRGLAHGAAEVSLALDAAERVSLLGIRGHGPSAWYGRTELLPARDGAPAAVAAVVCRGTSPPPLTVRPTGPGTTHADAGATAEALRSEIG